MYVYAIWDSAGAIKIGKCTHNPIIRLNILQCGNVNQLQLAAWDVRTCEAAMHRQLRAQRLRGEWFAAGSREVLAAIGAWDWADAAVLGKLWRRVEGVRRRRGVVLCHNGILARWG
jgi:hypothetical protein